MAQPVTKHHRPKTQFFSTLLGLHCVKTGTSHPVPRHGNVERDARQRG